MLVALLDPFGFEPLQYYTRYWSIGQQNTQLLPISGVFFWNRLIWSALAFLVLFIVYRFFNFAQSAPIFGRAKKPVQTPGDHRVWPVEIRIPLVARKSGFWANVKRSWRFSDLDYRYVVRNWTFIILLIIASLFSWLIITLSGQMFGTATYPVTWKILQAISSIYGFFLQIIILLLTGMLTQRSRQTQMHLLIDVSPIPNWVLLTSQAMALFKVIWTVMAMCLITGVIYQAYEGYYRFEIGHYFYELFVLGTLKYAYLVFFALLIHRLIKNYFVGFIIGLVILVAMPSVSRLGIEQDLFIPNADPHFTYSDMNGYGDIRHFVVYRLYWGLFGLILFGLTLLFWRNGEVGSMKEKFINAKNRLIPGLWIPMMVIGLAFLSLGYAIYVETNHRQPFYGKLERELQQVNYEKQYASYQELTGPRLVDVKVALDLIPEQRNFRAQADFTYVNRSSEVVDSIFMNLPSDLLTTVHFDRKRRLIKSDSVLAVEISVLEKGLAPGDSLRVHYEIENRPNGFLFDRSPVLANGTFLNNSIFPVLNYNQRMEVQDNQVRKKYDLPDKFRLPDPADSANWMNNYISQEADWINFEATISTSPDQLAVAPGNLQREWESKGRRYFHYKMDMPMLNFYAFVSARYHKREEDYKGKKLEIYYHRKHEYNIERMLAALKDALDYYQENFSPYQFQQIRVLEFPRLHGTFAQAFANTVPFSEAIGFIAQVDGQDTKGTVDYPYAVTAHEFAHQWWAHQVIGAYARGSTMLSESLAEYSALEVLERRYGKRQMNRFLRDALNAYLAGRSAEKIRETPLMYNENQSYIHYNKGSLAMYTFSELRGEQPFHAFLSKYIKKVAFQDPPYTTSIDFVHDLRETTPDSLQYLINDLFQTVTLYDNRIDEVTLRQIDKKNFELTIDFTIRKYQTDSRGKRNYRNQQGDSLMTKKTGGKTEYSLPLNDAVDITIRSPSGEDIYRKRLWISQIENELRIPLEEKPAEIIIDPNSMLLDAFPDDNKKRLP